MYLDVGDGHNIYFEEYGNPTGIKILFLHGGPGLGFSDSDKRLFDPGKFNVLFIDQRGCGRSEPKGELGHNTTQDLLSDIDKVLDFLQIDSITIFAGSWGATLAVLYAAYNEERVDQLILRGFFSATKACTDIYLRGTNRKNHPEAWDHVASNVPDYMKGQEAEFYFDQIIEETESSGILGKAWARYGLSLSRKSISEHQLNEIMATEDVDMDRICIELNYALNDFFIPDGYVFLQASNIQNTPVIIIHGAHDYLCPLADAQHLKSCIPNSTLIIVDAGHSVAEKQIEEALQITLNEL